MDMDKVASLGVTISSVFKGLYDYYQMVKKAPAKSQQLHEELYAISNISLNLKKSMMVSKFPSQRTKNFISTETLAQFEDMLHEMERKIALPEGQVTLERLKWPFTLKENLEYIARIERFKTTLNLSLSVHQRYISPIYENRIYPLSVSKSLTYPKSFRRHRT
jgi:hypothetical protein